MQTVSSPVATTKTKSRGLRVITAVILVLLGAQFLIGTLVNLYVQVPSAHPGEQAANYFQGVVQAVVWAAQFGPLYLLAHVIIGFALFLLSILLIIVAIAQRKGGWIVASVIGFLGIVGAGFNGASFMNYGHDFSSLLMSVGFLLAAIAYTIGIAAS